MVWGDGADTKFSGKEDGYGGCSDKGEGKMPGIGFVSCLYGSAALGQCSFFAENAMKRKKKRGKRQLSHFFFLN